MNNLPAIRERLYYVIKQVNGLVKYYDSHLNIIISDKEFKVLSANNYFANLTVKFDNYLEQ